MLSNCSGCKTHQLRGKLRTSLGHVCNQLGNNAVNFQKIDENEGTNTTFIMVWLNLNPVKLSCHANIVRLTRFEQISTCTLTSFYVIIIFIP